MTYNGIELDDIVSIEQLVNEYDNKETVLKYLPDDKTYTALLLAKAEAEYGTINEDDLKDLKRPVLDVNSACEEACYNLGMHMQAKYLAGMICKDFNNAYQTLFEDSISSISAMEHIKKMYGAFDIEGVKQFVPKYFEQICIMEEVLTSDRFRQICTENNIPLKSVSQDVSDQINDLIESFEQIREYGYQSFMDKYRQETHTGYILFEKYLERLNNVNLDNLESVESCLVVQEESNACLEQDER